MTEPDHECSLCPRLRSLVVDNRRLFPDWHNGPVATWYPPEGSGSVELLIVGLAPGLRGANRTGVPFTGDHSGELLYETLGKHGFAKTNSETLSADRPHLRATAVTNAVRCVPPGNKPIASEINTCRTFLTATIGQLQELKTIVTLGKVAHDSTIRALGGNPSHHPFGHANETRLGGLSVFSSYHCSRYNTNTGRLTPEMFNAVFEKVALSLLAEKD